VAVRSPPLYRALRLFALAAFGYLGDEAQRAPLEFAFEEHAAPGRPPLYEYRPLVRGYVEKRARGLALLEDARIALAEVAREPAAGVFAQAHAPSGAAWTEALFRGVLLPLVAAVAEACGGFDWDDTAFEHAYARFEQTLFGDRREYAALAPLVGVTVRTPLELGRGLRVREAVRGELAAHWPEARGLLPAGFERAPARAAVLELRCQLDAGERELPDAPGELADAVSALRLALSGPIAAGPVLFERLDWRPLAVRPVLPIASTEPAGEPTRLDEFRGRLARDLLERTQAADGDPELAEALDRWELSLFQPEPFCSEQLRSALAALLGGSDGLFAACVRVSVLLGETGQERADLLARLRAGEPDAELVRRALVETLMHGDRARLIDRLDESLLGLRPRPPSYFAVRAAATA
jgi:hypothetical protein